MCCCLCTFCLVFVRLRAVSYFSLILPPSPSLRGLLACLPSYFERTRTPLTSFIHSFQFSMMLFSSAMLKPVSFRSWSTYVVAGLPLFLAPCFGSQSSRSLITSSFFLQQCPINRSLLIISVSVILGRLPYSSLLVLCSKRLGSSGRKRECLLLARPFFLVPTTSKRLLRGLARPNSGYE